MEKFEHVRDLGSGGFATVNLVRRKNDKKEFAIKTISPQNPQGEITSKEIDMAIQESNVLKEINFINIVK